MELFIRSGDGMARVWRKALPTVARRRSPTLTDGAGSAPCCRASTGKSGYTLIELMIVMAIISIMMAIAVPLYQKTLTRTKESLLRNNLFTLRTVIDEYTFDKKKAPQALQDLVNEGYLRAIPIDPITGNDQWGYVMEDSLTMVDQTQPGIWDVHSLSDKISLEGTPYSQSPPW
jgi:general secretion pathway protein G